MVRKITQEEIDRIEALKEQAKTDESVLDQLTAEEVERYAEYHTALVKARREGFIREHGDPRVGLKSPPSSPISTKRENWNILK